MSEFWVSKKKYYCKYCEIYIADDAPSRNHHESGMRHKGNLERYIRGIYKTGEKRKKDLEEEKREMARVEQLANAAFAEDVGAGRAAPAAGPSKPVAARRPAPRNDSGGPWANYSTAESLGFTDPDVERLEKEAEVRRSQGVAGEWEVIPVAPAPVPEAQEEEEDNKSGVTIGEKRPADAAGADEEDTRSYKLRKKTLSPGGLLGDVYDPGMIPIKLKKKEEPVKQEELVPPKPEEVPLGFFKPLQLKPSSNGAAGAEGASQSDAPSTSAPKWSKSGWGAAGPSPPMPAPPPPPPPAPTEPVQGSSPAPITKEEASDIKPLESELKAAEAAPAPVFKKRKAPASSARGRRPI